MVFDNDFSDDGIVKTDRNDKMQYGSIVDEATSLLGEREDKSAKDIPSKKTSLSRLGFVGSLVAFLALTSSFLMNRNKDTGTTTAGVGLLKASSSSSTPEGIVHYTSGGFAKGAGYPIFVIENQPLCDANTFQEITNEAITEGAYIIAGDYGTALLETIAAVRDDLECDPDETHPEYCLVIYFDCGGVGVTNLLVSTIDYNNNVKFVSSVDTKDENEVVMLSDTIGDTLEASDLLARDDVSDGILESPVILEPIKGGFRDDCINTGAKNWTENTEAYHLTIEVAEHYTVTAKDGKYQTRAMNGMVFGPLIRVKRGETFRVYFENRLEDPPDLTYNTNCNNLACNPNHSNLHYHGAHVSGEEPSDDVELKIKPGACYKYESVFPDNHMPGTHWMHPHFHGSSTIQLGGGAALSFIVEDDPDKFPIPPEVETANDVLLFVQSMNEPKLKETISWAYGSGEAKDPNIPVGEEGDYFNFEPRDVSFKSFRFVNGQYRPSLEIKTGEWNRLRVVYAGWDDSKQNLDWRISQPNNCEQYLLAKDGIYIKDYPRKLDYFPVPAGGRADIMLRCNIPGEYKVTSTYLDVDVDDVLMTIVTVGVPDRKFRPGPTENFDWKFPDYLKDVLDEEVTDQQCKCSTDMGGSDDRPNGRYGINRIPFKKGQAVHNVEFGELVERELIGFRNHPYHQHVYPFQLSKGFEPEDTKATHDGYFKNGDWHDVLRAPDTQNKVFMKYKANVHLGKVMLHCHRLAHEDFGMMSQEHIEKDLGCKCDVHKDPDAPTGPASEAPSFAPNFSIVPTDSRAPVGASDAPSDGAPVGASDAPSDGAPIGVSEVSV